MTLLAPAAPGQALVGPGLAGVDRCLSWDGIEVSRLLADGDPPPGPLREVLSEADAIVAYTRDAAVARVLEGKARQVIVLDPSPPPGQHSSWWLARPLEALGAKGVEAVPSDVPTEAEAAEIEQRSRALAPGFLAVHPGSGSALKNWPAARFAQLIGAWRRATVRRSWLLCLGPAEGEGPPELRRLEPDLIARDWRPRSLGALLARAGAFVGNDSGASHLAAAWGAPTLALFGPTDPAQWSPCGERTRVVRSPTGRMEDLSADSVAAELRAFSGREPSGGRVGPDRGERPGDRSDAVRPGETR